jgi:hypothetical protein
VFSSTRKFSKPDQTASSTIAIKPEVRGIKQLDYGIGDTFVPSVLEVSFALIDFRASRMEGSRMPQE